MGSTLLLPILSLHSLLVGERLQTPSPPLRLLAGGKEAEETPALGLSLSCPRRHVPPWSGRLAGLCSGRAVEPGLAIRPASVTSEQRAPHLLCHLGWAEMGKTGEAGAEEAWKMNRVQ